MKTKLSHDRMTEILQDPELMRQAIQQGIKDALRIHKLLGNPICVSRDGKVVWIQPEDIPD